MEGWQKWMGKKIFLRTRINRAYSGNVIEVDDKTTTVFLTIIDKYGKNCTLAVSEIVEIKEED
jgi:hypothetical protein